jgi:hypothetical protein
MLDHVGFHHPRLDEIFFGIIQDNTVRRLGSELLLNKDEKVEWNLVLGQTIEMAGIEDGFHYTFETGLLDVQVVIALFPLQGSTEIEYFPVGRPLGAGGEVAYPVSQED